MIQFARSYTLRLLEHIEPDDWFRETPGGVTHVAWQVGHMAIAEYWLAMVRIRGERAEDETLIPKAFQAPFERHSVPCFDKAAYPSQREIRTVLDRVHEQAMIELPGLDDAALDEPVLKPHQLVATKLRALHWCAHHEGVHAGQIGLLRRFMGHPPIW